MKSKPSTPQEAAPTSLPSTIATIAVAQICASAGYRGSQASALAALARAAALYIEVLARSAAAATNSDGRTQSNLFDLVLALEHLESGRGFDGASSPCSPLLRSGALRQLVIFVRSVPELPFARPFRLRRPFSATPLPTFALLGREPPAPHIPPWLPAFPNPISGRGGGGGDRCDEERKEEQVGDGEKGEKRVFGLPIERARVRFRIEESAEDKRVRKKKKMINLSD